MSRLRSERGVAMTELLVAMSLAAVVLGAVLSPLDSLWTTTRRNERQNSAQDRARIALDRMARELRNVAALTQAVERAEEDDLAFQTVDASSAPSGQNAQNIQRVRYCLDGSQRIWMQRQTWTTSQPPALPTSSACPHSSWGTETVAFESVTNGNRSVWSYDSADPHAVSRIRVELYVDADTGEAPAESHLRTGVFLRNQNEAPVASFTASLTGNRHVLLNAYGSSDPEGGTLSYRWFDGTTQIGTGVTLDYESPTTGSHTFKLQVTDPSGLTTESAPQVVNVT
jgi:type II secretory pathway pseudopilin PulG